MHFLKQNFYYKKKNCLTKSFHISNIYWIYRYILKVLIEIDFLRKRKTWLFRTFKVLENNLHHVLFTETSDRKKMYKSIAVLNLKRFNSVYFYCLHRPFRPPSPTWGFMSKNTFTLWWSHFVVYLVVPRENIIQFQRVVFAVNKN